MFRILSALLSLKSLIRIVFQRLMPAYFILTLFFLLTFSCQESSYKFKALTSGTTGIAFENKIVSTPEFNILNYLYFYNGGGVACGDFNNDGLDDLYFTSNLEADKIYLNLGDMRFRDITSESGIENAEPWTAGVTTVDINNDGWLDLYVCKLGDYRNVKGHNLLFVNQGLNENKIPTFKEQSSQYLLDISAFSTQASFFDFDRDGDLDLFLLNHSVHPNRSYGRGSKREQIDLKAGDKLFENLDGKFIDISFKAGIFQGEIGYGLGLSVSDINGDSFPDIYVGNDFFENDYLYINNTDGTFSEIISRDISSLGHTTHFSMGNDIADVNNDMLPDILSVDMLPEDLETYKTSALEYNYQIYTNYLKNGYAPQFMQNTLHLNRGELSFSETAHLSGIAATEWSWSPLLADFDNDGLNDIFISNGILGATNDMDFINFIANESIQKKIESGLSKEDQKFIYRLPEKKTINYFFRNIDGNRFEDVSSKWIKGKPSFSNGSVYSDLDNDGDLDLVVNNVNEKAYVLENRGLDHDRPNHYIQLRLEGKGSNRSAIGSKIYLFSDGNSQFKEHYVSRGYLSSVSHKLHFGLGQASAVDSLRIEWPDGAQTLMYDLPVDTLLTIEYSSSAKTKPVNIQRIHTLTHTDSIIKIQHRDNSPIEFNRDPLIPFASSNFGPDLEIGDINGDGLQDIFFCGPKGQASSLYIQLSDGGFEPINDPFLPFSTNEDLAAEFGDFDNDGDLDLVVVSGGNEFMSGETLKPRFYRNDLGSLIYEPDIFHGIEVNASGVRAADFDKDGDLDICIISDCIDLEFGKTPRQYLLVNDGKGQFSDRTKAIAPEFASIGNVKDVDFADLNSDQYQDMIVAGYWMPITVFYGSENGFISKTQTGLDNTHGWWNTVRVHDIDRDGDLDLIGGNWGLNTRLNASPEEPVNLYSYDFNNNGRKEPLVTYFSQGVETPFSSKEDLAKQMPFINKEFLSYKAFARASLEEVFGKENLEKADRKAVYVLASCYFLNDGQGGFYKKELPFMAQVSSVQNIVIYDFNNDRFDDLLLTGNNYEISTQLSRLDASHGELLINDQKGGFNPSDSLKINLDGVIQDSEFIRIGEDSYLLFGRNNNTVRFLKLNR